MKANLIPALERILLTLWVGSLWVVGFVVAPLLFAELHDRALAGSTAGTLFTVTSYIGLASWQRVAAAECSPFENALTGARWFSLACCLWS